MNYHKTSLRSARRLAVFALYTVSPIFDLRSIEKRDKINQIGPFTKGAENTMALRKIVTVGDPILTKVCRPVTKI